MSQAVIVVNQRQCCHGVAAVMEGDGLWAEPHMIQDFWWGVVIKLPRETEKHLMLKYYPDFTVFFKKKSFMKHFAHAGF